MSSMEKGTSMIEQLNQIIENYGEGIIRDTQRLVTFSSMYE